MKVSITIDRDAIDVTSMSRPDPNWSKVDAAGHEHCWHNEDGPATSYYAARHYHVPTCEEESYVVDLDEDGEEIFGVRLRCRRCREIIEPGRTADTHQQFIAGQAHVSFNGIPVTRAQIEAAINGRLVLDRGEFVVLSDVVKHGTLKDGEPLAVVELPWGAREALCELV